MWPEQSAYVATLSRPSEARRARWHQHAQNMCYLSRSTPSRANVLHVAAQRCGNSCYRHTTPYHAMPYNTIPYHTIPRHATPRHATPRHAMPCYTMLCHPTPPHATPRHAMLCHAAQCYAMLCRIKWTSHLRGRGSLELSPPAQSFWKRKDLQPRCK